MTETLDLLLSHRSDRDFTDQDLTPQQLDAIVRAAWLAPTSINSQQISLVVVQDPQHRARIAEIAGGQPWIAKAPVFITVVVDHHKTSRATAAAGSEHQLHSSVEGLASAATDAGIALANLIVAARAQGLGAVPIGGIRRDPGAMVELLGLPARTFPLVGVSIGHVGKQAVQKPRLPLDSFCHMERYDAEIIDTAIPVYDQELLDYWQSIGRADGQSWSKNTAQLYSKVYFPHTKAACAAQGFTNEA